MADAFNLTAQLNLRGPSNIRTVVADIRRQIGTVNADLKFKIDPTTTRNLAQLNSTLRNFNSTLNSTQTSATNAARAISSLGRAVNGINVKNLPQQINSAANAVGKLSSASASNTKALQTASTEMQEFGKQAYLAVRRFAAFSGVTGVIFSVTGAIQKGVEAFIEYDRQFVKLQQVTGESAAGLQNLSKTITGLATGLGVASSDITEVASTLAQAGLSARDTERALKALALSSLAPSFDDMNETVEGSIALMRQFGINAGQLEGALGSVNAVAAKFAVEASDIITAIQRTGGVFATASKGVSEGTDALNEFVAVFTSVRATTRESAETIATGLRTIFTRIQRGSTIEALKEYGVNLTDLDGKFVGAYKAVELLSQGLNKLDPRDLKFSNIVEELGGFRQIGKVIPLIQQFATAQDALKVAQRGQGSLALDAAKAQDSLSNKIVKVKEEFFALFREIGNSDGFQTLIRGALDLSSALIKIADSIKGVLPALGIFAAFKGVSALTQFTSGFVGSAKVRQKSDGGPIRKFATGGLVPGQGNTDTVPAMLTPGEFVIRKKAVAAIGSQNLHKMNKYADGGTIKQLKGSGNRGFGKKTIQQYQKDNPNIEDDDYINTASTKIIREKMPLSVNDFTNSLPDVSNKDTLIRKQKSYDAQIGNIAENLLIKKLKLQKYPGMGTKNSNSSNAPIDLRSENKQDLYEVKFKNEETTDAELYSKLFRYKLEQEPGLILQQFKEKVVNKKDGISLGNIKLLEAGDLRSKVDELYRPKLSTKVSSAPLIDDILDNAKGSVLPSKVALEKLVQTGYGALDFDRTLQRTTGDAAYARARTPQEKEAVLSKYFRDKSNRLADAKNARLTQFGKALQEAIKNKQIDPKNLSIISKSSRVPGLAEHINELFGIPAANMVFTSGGSKEPALEAMRTKGPRVNRVLKNLGGFIQRFSVGGGVKDLASMIPSEILNEAKKYGIDVPFTTRDILRKRKALSATDSLIKQKLFEKITQARGSAADKAQSDSAIAARRKIAVVGITGDRIEQEVSTPGFTDKQSGQSVRGVPATLQSGALPPSLAKRVQALIRGRIETLVRDVGIQIARSAGTNAITDKKTIRNIASKDIEDIAGSIFEKALGAAGGNYDPLSKAIDFPSGLNQQIAGLLGVDAGVMTDATYNATSAAAKRKVAKGQFDRGRLEARSRFGRSQFALGGTVQKFAEGGQAQTPQLYTRGSLVYSVDDMKEAAQRKGMTFEQLKALLEERQDNHWKDFVIPYYDLEKRFGLTTYKPQDTNLFQKVMAAKIDKEDRIETWKQKQGLATRDYEGRSERQKGFLSARQNRRGFALGGTVQKFVEGGQAQPEFYTRGSLRYSIEDMQEAAARNGITLQKLKELLEARQDNAFNDFVIPPHEVAQKFGLLTYKPQDTGLFQKVMNARIEKEDRIATWKQKQGIGTGDYEGRSERQKGFLAARQSRRGFASGGKVGLGSNIYDLQKGTGLTDREFNDLVYFAKTNDFNEQQFKNYLTSHLQNKQRKQALGTDTEALRRSLLGGATTTSSQMLLAQQLMGAPDAKWNPKYDKARFAVGGSVEDTVPALLTPGEFVINKKAAQRIGTSRLHQLNRADKIQGFNKGGVVQRFARGGSPEKLAESIDSFDAVSDKAVKALDRAVESLITNIVDQIAKKNPSINFDDAYATAQKEADPSVSFGLMRQAESGDQSAANAVADAQRKQVNALVKQIRAIDSSVSISDARAAAERRVADAWGGLYKRVKEQDAATASNTKILGMQVGSFRGAFGGKGPLGAVTGKIADVGDSLGNFSLKGIAKGAVGLANPLNAVKNLSGLGRGLSGEKGFYISMGLGALAGQGENIFGKETGKRGADASVMGMSIAGSSNAMTAAGLEAGTTTLSAGLATASSLAMIPGVGPFAAGLTAAVSVVKAWTSAVEAGKKAAEDFANEQRQKGIDDAGDQLGKSLDKFQRSPGGAKEQASVVRDAYVLSQKVGRDSLDDLTTAERRKKDDALANQGILDRINSFLPSMSIAGYSIGGTTTPEASLGVDEIRAIAKDRAKAAEPAADAARKVIEARIQSGSTMAEISKMPDFKNLTETIARANQEFIFSALINKDLSAEQRKRIIDEKLAAEANKLLGDAGFKAQENIAIAAKAMDEANRAGRDLAMSFDRMADTFNQSLGRATYELEQFQAGSSSFSNLISGEASIGRVSSRDSNILRNPRAYSTAESNAAMDRASSMFGDDKDAVRKMLGINATDFAQSIRESVESDLRGIKPGTGDANLSLEKASSTAKKNLEAKLADAPENVRSEILQKFEAIVKQIDNTEGSPQEKVNRLIEAVDNQLGGAASEAARKVQDMALAMLDFKTGALNAFIEGVNNAAKAEREAQKIRMDARDTVVRGRDSIRQTLGFGGPSIDELQTRQFSRVRELTGGPTNARAIREQIQADMTTLQGADGQGGMRKQLETLQNNADPNNKKQQEEIRKLTTDMSQLNSRIEKSKNALDGLANNADVAGAALERIKEMQQAMEGQGDFLDKLATATPEEAEKLGQAFMRLQNNLNGGTNTLHNNREAQIAFFKTLRETNNPIMAQRASMGVLAQQRGETMSLFKELIPLIVAQRQAQGVEPEAIQQELKILNARLTGGVYAEAGFFQNPMLAQRAQSTVDYRRNGFTPGMMPFAELADTNFQNQAAAKEEQAALQQFQSAIMMKSAAEEFTKAIQNFVNNYKESRDKDKPVAGVPVAARARGGVIYASKGQMVNFQPKGTDTVPAMLTPGEFVVNAKSTAKNLPLLKSINSGAYSKGGSVRYLADGGYITGPDPLDLTDNTGKFRVKARVVSRQLAFNNGDVRTSFAIERDDNKKIVSVDSKRLSPESLGKIVAAIMKEKERQQQEDIINKPTARRDDFLSKAKSDMAARQNRDAEAGRYINPRTGQPYRDAAEKNAVEKTLAAEQAKKTAKAKAEADRAAKNKAVKPKPAVTPRPTSNKPDARWLSLQDNSNRQSQKPDLSWTNGQDRARMESTNRPMNTGGNRFDNERFVDQFGSAPANVAAFGIGAGKAFLPGYAGTSTASAVFSMGSPLIPASGPFAPATAAVLGLVSLGAGIVTGRYASGLQENILDSVVPETNQAMNRITSERPYVAGAGQLVGGVGGAVLAPRIATNAVGQSAMKPTSSTASIYAGQAQQIARWTDKLPKNLTSKQVETLLKDIDKVSSSVPKDKLQSLYDQLVIAEQAAARLQSKAGAAKAFNEFLDSVVTKVDFSSVGSASASTGNSSIIKLISLAYKGLPKLLGKIGVTYPTDNTLSGWFPTFGKALKGIASIIKPLLPTGALYGYQRLASNQSPQKKSLGGLIYASTGTLVPYAPKGTDTVPAMLTPGEFVVNRAATQKHLPLLKSINQSRGGRISYLANGGSVGDIDSTYTMSAAAYNNMAGRTNSILTLLQKQDPRINQTLSYSKKTNDTVPNLLSKKDFDKKVIGTVGKSTGGMIYASEGTLVPYAPKGTDTVPAMLTPGEFVINREATRKNLPLLKSINNGTASKPYSKGGVVYLQQGGQADPDAFAANYRNVQTAREQANLQVNVPENVWAVYDSFGGLAPASTADNILKMPGKKKVSFAKWRESSFVFANNALQALNIVDKLAAKGDAEAVAIQRLALPIFFEKEKDRARATFISGRMMNIRKNKIARENIRDIKKDKKDPAMTILKEVYFQKDIPKISDFNNSDPNDIKAVTDRAAIIIGAIDAGVKPERALRPGQLRKDYLDETMQNQQKALEIIKNLGNDIDYEGYTAREAKAWLNNQYAGSLNESKFIDAVGTEVINQKPELKKVPRPPQVTGFPIGTVIPKFNKGGMVYAQKGAKILGSNTYKAGRGPYTTNNRLDLGGNQFDQERFNTQLDTISTGLSAVGMVPGFGEPFDLAAGTIDALRGDYVNAGLSLASSTPFIGSIAGAGKIANKLPSPPLPKQFIKKQAQYGPPKPSDSDKWFNDMISTARDLTPAKEGTTRLYRIGDIPRDYKPPENAKLWGKEVTYQEWLKQNELYKKTMVSMDTNPAAAAGKWFTDTPEQLDFYIKQHSDELDKLRAYFIDIKNTDLHKYNVKNSKFEKNSLNHDREFIIPQADNATRMKGPIGPSGYYKGGVVYASQGQLVDFAPKGTDTVPAMLTPGEFVVNAKSTAQHLPLLKAINNGSAAPQKYSTGGLVYLQQGGTTPPQYSKNSSTKKRADELAQFYKDEEARRKQRFQEQKKQEEANAKLPPRPSTPKFNQGISDGKHIFKPNELIGIERYDEYRVRAAIVARKLRTPGETITLQDIQNLESFRELLSDDIRAGYTSSWGFTAGQQGAAMVFLDESIKRANQALNANFPSILTDIPFDGFRAESQRAQDEFNKIPNPTTQQIKEHKDTQRAISGEASLRLRSINSNKNNSDATGQIHPDAGYKAGDSGRAINWLSRNQINEVPRMWVDDTGKYSTLGYFNGMDANGKNILLRKPDGQIVSVPVNRLSSEDRAYIQSQKPKNTKPQTKASGGIVYANNGALISAKNKQQDTVPAMLTPGEYVVNKDSAQKHMPLLNAINKGYYNRGGMVEYLNNGGVVGPKYYANGGINPVEAARQMSFNRGANGVNTSGATSSINSAIQQEPEWLSKLDEKVNAIKEGLGGMYSNLNNVANQLNTVAQELPREMSITSNINKNLNVNGIAGEWNKYQGDVLKMAGEQASKTIQDDKVKLAKWSEGAIPVIG